MKLNFFFPATAAVLATIGFFQATPAQAQTSNNPLADFQEQKSSDPFSNRGGDSSNSGMMDLIHRAMQGPVPDLGAFNAANRENLNDAAAAFRAKQQKLLKQRLAAQGSTELKTVPSGTILLPGALSSGVAPGSLILAPNITLPVQSVPVTP